MDGWQNWITLDSELLNRPLFTIAGTPITSATLLVFVLVIVVTLLTSFLVRKAVGRALALRQVQGKGTIEVAQRLLHYGILAIGFAIALQTVGVNLSALFAAGAVFAIGLGFAMQNIMQNFVAGVILLTERSVTPGDVIEVDGRIVRVINLGIRSTLARTLDEEEMIIPNTTIVQSPVTNYTLRDSLYRLRVQVGVTYDSDMKQVGAVLKKAADAIEWRVKDRDPVILMTEFGASSVDWEVSVWIDDPWTLRRSKSELYQAVWWALKEADVVIAFPQMDLHLDDAVVDSLRRTG